MEQFKSWNELSKREQLEATWWDMYKDVNGFRPRHIDTSAWDEERFDIELRILGEELTAVVEREAANEKRAIEKLEDRIQALMNHGARNREMAIRWLDEAYETQGDMEYLEWNLGVPYGYLSSKTAVV